MSQRAKASRLSTSAVRTFQVARDKLIRSNELLHEQQKRNSEAILVLHDDNTVVAQEIAANDHVLSNLVGFLP